MEKAASGAFKMGEQRERTPVNFTVLSIESAVKGDTPACTSVMFQEFKIKLGSYHVARDSLEFMILLPHPSECLNERHAPPKLANSP